MAWNRVVVYNEEMGIFLGHCLGLAFWSKLDAAGQEYACAFSTTLEAANFVEKTGAMGPYNLADWRIVPVMTEDDRYASINECVAAGLPAWDPKAVLPALTIH